MDPLEFVYKRVDDLVLKLDVYLPAHASQEKPAPICIWWHGGGLFQGTRKREYLVRVMGAEDTGIPAHLLRLPDIGITLISPDYRLAPQADIYSVLEDANSAVEYVRTDLQRLLNIDPSKLALIGGSAGGWLALLSGIPCHMTGSLSSPPTCIAALYPMVDVHTPFYTTPQRPLPWMNDLIPHSAIATDIDPHGPIITSSTKQDTRALVCDYVTQEGIWHELWTANSTKPNEQDTFSITPRVHRAGKCPPVWITTGSLDQCIDSTGVPNLVHLMREYGMDVDWEEREGLGHSFDFEIDERVQGLQDFLVKHLQDRSRPSSAPIVRGESSI